MSTTLRARRMSDALRERLWVTNRTFQSFSSGPGSTRPIGRALTPPVSASVTSQQYHTRAILFAASVKTLLISISARLFFSRDLGKTFSSHQPFLVNITFSPCALLTQLYT